MIRRWLIRFLGLDLISAKLTVISDQLTNISIDASAGRGYLLQALAPKPGKPHVIKSAPNHAPSSFEQMQDAALAEVIEQENQDGKED